MKLLIMHSSPATSSLLGPDILLIKLFSHILNLYSSFSVRDKVSHPYKIRGKIMALDILIFILYFSRRNGKTRD
jgi:hypothetical protein